ncbi:MAG TPA: ribonuclease PH [Dehalococcoidia bacterium]|nr:ribonuclease PH [Dehalococcoidia bacterium]
MARIDNRAADQLRPVRMTLGYQSFAEGSVLIELGKTMVLCSVTLEDRVPPFLKGSGEGWVTAEYSMLPRSTLTRTPRERAAGGRSHEIQRLIGRSLRAATDLTAFGERTMIVDCDVLQADGGTRTAAITGAYIALYQAFHTLRKKAILRGNPLTKMIAATSVGIVNGEHMLDLCYEEDFRADVDFNVVMTDRQEFVEIQGTAEHRPFSREDADALLELAGKGIQRLFQMQRQVLRDLA